MILARRTILAAAVESVEGVPEALSAANCMRIANANFVPQVEMNRRPLTRDSVSKIPDLPGIRSSQITFDVELVGNSVGGTPPEWSALMKGCGFVESAGSGTITYSLSSVPSDFKSLTIGVYTDGMLSKLWGARGTVSLVMQGGKPGVLRFSFRGADFEITDTALPVPSLDSSIPAPFKGATFTVEGQALKVGSLTLSLNNQLDLRKDITKQSGHSSAMITGRDASGEFDPELELVATHDFYGLWKSGQTSALTAEWGANVAKIHVSSPCCQYRGVRWQDKGALRGLLVDFSLTENTGSDELELTVGSET